MSLDLVKEFHQTYGQPIEDRPHILDQDLNAFRLDLLYEELDELRDALDAGDIVEVVDALGDLQYVLDGAFLAFGYHKMKDAVMKEIHRSNMSKLGPDGLPVLREDGKVMKGPDYSPPDLASVLRDYDVY